jgi:hypothetical protein
MTDIITNARNNGHRTEAYITRGVNIVSQQNYLQQRHTTNINRWGQYRVATIIRLQNQAQDGHDTQNPFFVCVFWRVAYDDS